MTPFLEVHDLLVQRGETPVLEIDRLIVEKGDVLAVVGPNGAGKSTLLLALARLMRVARGEIRLNGASTKDETDYAFRRRIALVLQDPLLFDTSVFGNVASGLRFRRLPKDEIVRRVDVWLERLGISHLRGRPATQLSGGEAQRVSLARALAIQPEILLLDEPFSALDAPTRLRLIEDLKALLASTGTTTLFITHDLKEASALGKKVAVILQGKLEQFGSSEEVFAFPSNPGVAEFLGTQSWG